MKNFIKIFFVAAFIFIGFVGYSQTSNELTSNNDNNARAVLASYYLEIPVNFDSPTAEACVNLLLTAHRNNVAYPILPIEKLTYNDQQKVQKLQNDLQALRNNPPTWDNILAKEEAKVAPKYTAPTAPVFAGNMSRTTINSPKNQTRIVGSSSNAGYKVVEQTTQNKPETQTKDSGKDQK